MVIGGRRREREQVAVQEVLEDLSEDVADLPGGLDGEGQTTVACEEAARSFSSA
jgi:hypothetical protein